MKLEDLANNIENIDDIIDDLIAPIKDYTDTIGDFVGPVKGIIAIYNIRKKKQLKSFIKGYYNALNTDQISEDNKKQLSEFFKNDKNVLLISEIIESAVSSLSMKSSCILGLIAGRILIKKTEKLSDKSYVLISALRNLTDRDLELFDQLYILIENNKIPYRETGENIVEYRMRDVFKEVDNKILPFDRSVIEFTIEKLKNYGILSFGMGGIGSYGNDRGAFMDTEYSKELIALYREV